MIISRRINSKLWLATFVFIVLFLFSTQISNSDISYQIFNISKNESGNQIMLKHPIVENLEVESANFITQNSGLGSQMVIDGRNKPVFLKTQFSKFSVKGLEINNITITNAPGSIIENQVFDGIYLNLTNSPYSIIRNNTIKNIIQTSAQYEGIGIYLQDSSHTLVTENDVDNIFSDNSASLGILATNSSYLQINNNLITGVGASDNAGVSGSYGIKIESGSDHSIIMNNNLNNINSQFAPVFGIMTESVNNITIYNNFISSVMIATTGFPTANGINIVSSSDVILENNLIEIIDSNTVNNLAFSFGLNIENSIVTVINNQIDGINAFSSSETHAYGISSDSSLITAINNRINNINSLGLSQGNSYGVSFINVNNSLFEGPNLVTNINGNNRSYDYFLERSYNNAFTFYSSFVSDVIWFDSTISSQYNGYEVTLFVLPENSGSWTPNDEIPIPIIGKPLGYHEFNLRLTSPILSDIFERIVNISILENYPPNLSGPMDMSLEEGVTDVLLSWNVTDSEPGNFSILLNNSKILDGMWFSGQIIEIFTGDLLVGTYNYTFLATDMFSLTNFHSVTVSVVDTTAPAISGPSTLEIEERVNNSIIWNIIDRNLKDVLVFMDNETVFNNSWMFDTILNFTLIELPVGEYNFTVQAIDAFGNSASVTTFVYSLDITAPAISGPSRILTNEGEKGKKIQWEVFDWNPNNYTIFRNNFLVENSTWKGLRTIEISLNDLNFGIWNFTLILQDLYNHTSSNSVIVSVSSGGTNTTTTDNLGFGDATIFIVGAAIGVSVVVVGGIVILRRRR